MTTWQGGGLRIRGRGDIERPCLLTQVKGGSRLWDRPGKAGSPLLMEDHEREQRSPAD